jgi:ADP-glucose pyrophosphorylase
MIATNDLAKETVAVVLAGGKGTRLGPLTHHVCKPAVTFGATYRNIDFSLSNCVNSGIFRIGVATQHKPERLLRHLDEAWGDVVVGPEHFIAPWPAEARAPKLGYRGTVRRSVLFSGVAVSEGADVADTVVLPGAIIGRNCRLRGAIVDSGCRIPDGMVIDRSRRGALPAGRGDPVVVTAEDVADNPSYARA